MIFLDAMIVNVAIPDIQQQFSVDESDMQWVVAAYSLTMAMFMMSGGTFGDHYGRRLGYIVGIDHRARRMAQHLFCSTR